MKKNNSLIIAGVLFAALILSFIGYNMIRNRNIKNNTIPDDYICVFHGGSGEITYSTYIYSADDTFDNYGFKYINTTNTTESWGSSNWNTKITGSGVVDWTDDVFKVAKENNAYSYVEEDGKIYSIEDFATRFLMD